MYVSQEIHILQNSTYWEKAYVIYLKKLGPNHFSTKDTKANLDELKE